MAERVLGGRYTVQDKIGTGGMAIVYRGLDEVLGRTVAIKTMLPQYAADPSFAARFKQEAQAAAALQSPYIVSVYDWGKDGDTYYIVMEYLRGTDLKSGIRKHGALDCKKVAQIGSQIAQALAVAHRHDIIHRDIKPQNIMVQPDGNIKVMDFGIARAKNSHLTTDNSVLGTAHYVSPEQTQGKELGPTTDIYSLGIVMYEAATGSVPFDGDDAISVALKQVNEQPEPPSQRNPAVDSALESIILKCMQKDPRDRFQTADELYHVLRDYLAGRLAAVSSATTMMPAAGRTNRLEPGTATTTMPMVGAEPMNPATSGNLGRMTNQQRAAQHAQQQAEEEKKAHKRHVGIAVALILVAIAAIVGVVLAFGGQTERQDVPNLLNLKEEDALQQISDSNFFERGTVTEEYSSTVAEGLVIDQDPDSGTSAERGTKINLVVSKGEEPAETVTVPNLQNMTPSEAEAALSKVGLVGKAGDSVYSSDVENGKVAAQSPAANSSAKSGDTVTYQLSKGAETVDIPDVTGDTESSATQRLENAGFTVQTKYADSDSVDKGNVISVSPTGSANKGATVTITVSNGSSKIDIPYVIGMSQSQAEDTISNKGFRYDVQERNSSENAGVVVAQSPSSGSADEGATITIYVSNGAGDSSSSSSSSNGSSNSSSGSDASTE